MSALLVLTGRFEADAISEICLEQSFVRWVGESICVGRGVPGSNRLARVGNAISPRVWGFGSESDHSVFGVAQLQSVGAGVLGERMNANGCSRPTPEV
jgi:hypothetical protein